MNKLLLLTTAVIAATNAYALDIRPYVEGKVNYNWLKAEYKDDEDKATFKSTAAGTSLEVGAKIDQFRVGLEGYYNDKAKKTKVDWAPLELTTKGVFLNGYWDSPLGEPKNIKPYIGAGIGYSWLKVTEDLTPLGDGKYSIKDKDWGWNVGFGVGYEITNNIDLTLGYRYENLGKIKDEDSKTKFTNHKVSLGLRYTF